MNEIKWDMRPHKMNRKRRYEQRNDEMEQKERRALREEHKHIYETHEELKAEVHRFLQNSYVQLRTRWERQFMNALRLRADVMWSTPSSSTILS